MGRAGPDRRTTLGCVLTLDPLADEFLSGGDEHAALPGRGIGQGDGGELTDRLQLSEPLVVIALLIGLLLPAVQKVRAAAARALPEHDTSRTNLPSTG